MELHEYQAKVLLQRFRVPCIPHFIIEKETLLDKIHGNEGGVLRPQVRGEILGGGEFSVSNKSELAQKVSEILGTPFVTDESNTAQFYVKSVLFFPKILWEKEVYLWVGVDFSGKALVKVRMGEKSIEESIPERKKLFRYQLTRLVSQLSLPLPLKGSFASIIDKVIAAFFHFEAKSIEIDPFIITDDRSILAYKICMKIDEYALFRQKEIREFLVDRQLTERERLVKAPFPYVMGEGTIGCLANGMGLAEFTAQRIRTHGGTIAGVMDIGDVPAKNTIVAGLNALIRDSAVNVVCINLSSGLIDGAILVSSILEALRAVPGGVIKSRFILRLGGTNAMGGCLLAESSNILKATTSLEEAVLMAVNAIRREI